MFRFDAHGNGFGRVDDAAAADGQDDLHRFPPGKLNALHRMGQQGIRLDAGEFYDGQPGIFQGGDHLVIDAVFLDAAFPINHEHLLTEWFDFRADALDLPLAENDFCRIFKNKTLHGLNPFQINAMDDSVFLFQLTQQIMSQFRIVIVHQIRPAGFFIQVFHAVR